MSIENIYVPEIKTEELLDLLKTIEWKNRYAFSFNGKNFQLLIIPKEDLAEDKESYGEEAEFHISTEINGFDIYLHDTIPYEIRNRILFHEILEADLIKQGFSDTAHEITIVEEERVFGKRNQ